METKTVLILANSRKYGGNCLAGREILEDGWGGWIRPVSARPHEEIIDYDRQLKDDSFADVLDVVEIPLIRPKPNKCQTENWLIAPDHWWVKLYTLTPQAASEIADNPFSLWLNGNHTYNGFNDQISEQLASYLTSSLYMIQVGSVDITIIKTYTGERRVQAEFEYNRIKYRLRVTDLATEDYFLKSPQNIFPVTLGECLLTISLSEKFVRSDNNKEYRYKLVAAIVEL